MIQPAGLVFLCFEVLGGLALFIFGMSVMTGGLRGAAGSRLRELLSCATTHRSGGLLFGTTLGFLVHSSAGSVMLVGFVNAGLISLGQAIAPIAGINLGTTLSMQVISLRLDDYCFAAIAAGFLVQMAAPGPRTRDAGRAIMGFGLLFLGMRIMSGAIRPHREWLAPMLEGIDGSTLRGMLAGVAAAALLTAVIQSSGATIGMCFALSSAGVFVRIEQVYPIVLGAHLGTCMTAFLGSIGTHIDARRTALSHFLFNVINVALGMAFAPLLMRWIPSWSDNLSRQIAHLHTVVMLLGVVTVVPLANPYVRLLRRLLGRHLPVPKPSCLDKRLLRHPEKALDACLGELERVAHLLLRSLRLDGELLFRNRRGIMPEIRRNEEFINEIKTALLDYLSALTKYYLSRRQTFLVQHFSRCISEIERIGDHIERMAELCRDRNRHGKAGRVDVEHFNDLFEAYRQAYVALLLVTRSLDPGLPDRRKAASHVIDARNAYFRQSQQTQERFAVQVAEHRVTPLAALYFSEILNTLDRMVRHARIIALAERHADFWIKRKKLELPAAPLPPPRPFQAIPPEDYLRRMDALHVTDILTNNPSCSTTNISTTCPSLENEQKENT